MKRVQQTFKMQEDSERGFIGLVPVGTGVGGPDDGFEPASGLGIAHDMLEHFPKAEQRYGRIEAELMALGAMYWLRGRSGWLVNRQQHPQAPIRSWAELVANDMLELEQRHRGDAQLYPAPQPRLPWAQRTVHLSGDDMDAEDAFRDLLCKSSALIASELDDGKQTYTIAGAGSRVLRDWLRFGYRKARDRYRGHNAYMLCETVFQNIEKIGDKCVARWGNEAGVQRETRIVIRADFDSETVTARVSQWGEPAFTLDSDGL